MADHDTHDHTGVPGVGTDVTDIIDIPTVETDDTLVLAPDGAGGVEWVTPTGGGGGFASGTATVSTNQGLTGNNSYVNLTTTGPSVTITVNTKCIVFLTADAANTTAGGYGAMGVDVSGANTIAAATAKAAQWGTSAQTFDHRFTAAVPLTGLTPGSTTFTAKYSQLGGAGTTNWQNRDLTVLLLD